MTSPDTDYRQRGTSLAGSRAGTLSFHAAQAAVVLLILFSAFLRFYKLDQKGLDGSDTIYYTNIAKAWSEGTPRYGLPEGRSAYRPAVFYLFGASIRLLGYHDYSIKMLNALADTGNVLLVFLITRLVSGGNAWAPIAAALAYCCLPTAIFLSRIELTHTLSCFFALFSVLVFLVSCHVKHIWRSRLLLALSGVLVGLAALSHEDMIFLTCGYLAFLAIWRFSDLEARPRLENSLISISILLASVLVTCSKMISMNNIFLRAAFHAPKRPGPVSHVELAERYWSYISRVLRFAWNALPGNSSMEQLYLFLALLALVLFSAARRALLKRGHAPAMPATCHLPFLVICGHLLAYCYVFNFYMSRLFFPLFPLVIIQTVSWSALFLRRLAPGLTSALLVSSMALLTLFNLSFYPEAVEYLKKTRFNAFETPAAGSLSGIAEGYRVLRDRNYSQADARRIYDLLKGGVRSDARLLVTPSLHLPYPGRRIFQVEYYFGDDAVYGIDHAEPLAELISGQQIGYVLFAAFNTRPFYLKRKTYTRYLYGGRWKSREILSLGASYGFSAGEYTQQKEYDFLRRYLAEAGARVLCIDGRIAAGTEAAPEEMPRYVVFELAAGRG